MKVLVAVKQVAALDEDFEIRADGKDVDRDFLVCDLNEWDDYSLEEAMKIKEAAATPVEVVAVCVGSEDADEALRKCLAKGADRVIRVWDESVAGSDSIAIARLIASVARREQPQLLFAGTQSADHAFAATGTVMISSTPATLTSGTKRSGSSARIATATRSSGVRLKCCAALTSSSVTGRSSPRRCSAITRIPLMPRLPCAP